jgi:hypothetical protein
LADATLKEKHEKERHLLYNENITNVKERFYL